MYVNGDTSSLTGPRSIWVVVQYWYSNKHDKETEQLKQRHVFTKYYKVARSADCIPILSIVITRDLRIGRLRSSRI